MIHKGLIHKLQQIILLSIFLSTSTSTSAAADDFLEALKILNDALVKNQAAQAKAQAGRKLPNQSNAKISEPTVDTVGYTKEFAKIKDLILSEQFDQAYQLEQKEAQDEANFLNSNEAGLLALDVNKPGDAIQHFAAAERYLKTNVADSDVDEASSVFGNEVMCSLSGFCNLSDYNGEPFERILMLNYKSIAYLLNGERKAYNVTRRAIDWQNIEHKAFLIELERAKEKLAEKSGKSASADTSEKVITEGLSTAMNVFAPGSGNIFKLIGQQYKDAEKTAYSVSSAYVNPFGDYIAGIVQEFDSFEDRSLRGNAKISYQSALKLNPKSKVIKQAVREVKKPLRRGKRLVQVVIADGFAPEKKTLHFRIPTPGGTIPVKLPIYQTVDSKVAHIRVKYGKKTLATASSVANIEAIILRHQMDSLPFQHFRVFMSIARSAVESVGWSRLGAMGQVFKDFRESFANPDMRSWMSLPKQLLAARFYVSKKLKYVTLITYDKRWRRLATQKVMLPKNEHGFIYARSIDKILTADVNKTLWVKPK